MNAENWGCDLDVVRLISAEGFVNHQHVRLSRFVEWHRGLLIHLLSEHRVHWDKRTPQGEVPETVAGQLGGNCRRLD